MDTDLVLTVGIVLAVFSLPACLSALSDGRSTRAAALCMLLAGGCVVWALTTKPGGYTVDAIFHAVIEQFARLVR